tara:strand:- start:588 stop:1016 length:429 start_codon:yes stop_codon:yes gene_type:complete
MKDLVLNNLKKLGWFLRIAIPSVAISLAVDNCPRLGSPEAFLNVVRFIPNFRAFFVINLAKLRSDFPKFSAITVATSFADLVTRANIAFLTEIVDPAERCNLEGGCLVALFETLNLVFIDIFFDLSASKTIYNVMIFVKEAG